PSIHSPILTSLTITTPPYISPLHLHMALPFLTVEVYNQTGSNSFSIVGTTPLTVNDTRPAPGVNSITPNPIDLASPPASFTVTGGGLSTSRYGLHLLIFVPIVLFIAQARTSSD